MRRLIILLILVMILALPVSAIEITAPPVPESGQRYMPDEPDTFAEGLWYILKTAIQGIWPEVAEAGQVCFVVFSVALITGIVGTLSEKASVVSSLAGVIGIGCVLIKSANTFISLGAETVNEINQYGKLLLPVMTAAVAAQGGVATSTALYGGTVFFSTILSSVIGKVMIPLLYAYLALSVAWSSTSHDLLGNMRNATKRILSWFLRTSLYVFTGYLTITGVVSGTTDAAAMKAAKLTISGAVPVVGNILSDASEAVLVGAGLVKNTAGIYGLLAVVSVCAGPFIKIGVQYLLLKTTAACSSIVGDKRINGLIKDFSGAMGLILAMAGTQSVLLLISTVCYMKGVG